jgi:hypothetical protein
LKLTSKDVPFKTHPPSAEAHSGRGTQYNGYWDGDIYRCEDDNISDHTVILVGYNEAEQYWIAKNSWGQEWNGDGYFKIGYEECYIEGLISYATYNPSIPTDMCGDANGDDQINVGDAVYLISYVFKGGPPPDPICVGDANADGDPNVGDAVYLIAYVFKGGPPPEEGCCP